MIELAEATVLSRQLEETLKGKTIVEVFNATSLHKFTFFYEDPLTYQTQLAGKQILSATGCGMFVNIHLSDDMHISFNDGANVRYGESNAKIPDKYQLLISFNDDSFLYVTVSMYAGIAVYQGNYDYTYYQKSKETPSPLTNAFDFPYFENLITTQEKNISLKALLATEQRIPGLGNGSLQEILFCAKLNPKRKIQSLSKEETKKLYNSIKEQLKQMTDEGGRDTETTIFGQKGGYKTQMSKNTYDKPCSCCGNQIVKEAYMGGSVYYCAQCQKV